MVVQDRDRIQDDGTNTLIRNGQDFSQLKVSGDVGIGTDSQTANLDVKGTITATSFSGDGSGLANLTVQTAEIENEAVIRIGKVRHMHSVSLELPRKFESSLLGDLERGRHA